MTQLIEKEMKELVREDLKNNPENFWKDLFNAVDHYVGVYVERLEKQGVDLDYLEYKIEKTIGVAALEGITLKEKLGSLISPLESVMSELNQTYLMEKEKQKSLEELNKDIQEKEAEIKKLQIEKENLEAISKDTESQMARVKDQTLYDLEEEIKDIRTFFTRLPEDIKSLEDDGVAIPDKFKKRIHRGIQDAYTILQEAKLWQQYDAKPEEIKFNKEERRVRRNQNKKNEEKDKAILQLTQDEQHLTKQLSEETVTKETTDTNTSILENNEDHQILTKATKQVDQDVKEKANIKDEKSSDNINERHKTEKNLKKDISAQVEMPIEGLTLSKADDTSLNEQVDKKEKVAEFIENTERQS